MNPNPSGRDRATGGARQRARHVTGGSSDAVDPDRAKVRWGRLDKSAIKAARKALRKKDRPGKNARKRAKRRAEEAARQDP